MLRFHWWERRFIPDFWTKYYKDHSMFPVTSFINSIGAANAQGFKLLNNYDLIDVGAHTPGRTVSWENIELTDYAYNPNGLYCHTYKVNYDWLDILLLYDKHVDPTITLMKNKDYIYRRGIISFLKKPLQTNLYVGKGQMVDRLLNDYYGSILGYSRYDSYLYRDTLETINGLFFIAPSRKLITATANLMVGAPVAKYDGEGVVSAGADYIVTTKNMYDDYDVCADPRYDTTLSRFEPLTSAVTLYSYPENPDWWKTVHPDMFQRFADTPIGWDERNSLMDLFLKHYVAHIVVDLDIAVSNNFKVYDDIKSLMFDGSSVRTAYLLSCSNKIIDINPPYPELDFLATTTKAMTCWANETSTDNNVEYINAFDMARPIIGSYYRHKYNADIKYDGEYMYNAGISQYTSDDPDKFPIRTNTWKVGDGRFHILDPENRFNEFWSRYPKVLPYVEPTISRCYWFYTETTDFSTHAIRAVDTVTEIPITKRTKIRQSMYAPNSPSSNMSVLTESPASSTTVASYIEGTQILRRASFSLWEINNAYIAVDALSVSTGTTGTAITPDITIGTVPKVLTITTESVVPDGTSIETYYSLNNAEYRRLTTNKISIVSGKIRFKFILTASSTKLPALYGTTVSIKPYV